MTVKTTGGTRLKQHLLGLDRAARGGGSSVKVGFFSTARYPAHRGGQSVAEVAYFNEFGTKPHTITAKSGKKLAFTGSGGKAVFADSVQHPGTPERPFFRQAIRIARSQLRKLAVQEMKRANRSARPDRAADQLLPRAGERFKNIIQQRIEDLRTPPNAPATAERKGSSNPLVDEGVMSTAVAWEIER